QHLLEVGADPGDDIDPVGGLDAAGVFTRLDGGLARRGHDANSRWWSRRLLGEAGTAGSERQQSAHQGDAFARGPGDPHPCSMLRRQRYSVVSIVSFTRRHKAGTVPDFLNPTGVGDAPQSLPSGYDATPQLGLRLSVVIPVYNELGTLPRVLRAVALALPGVE